MNREEAKFILRAYHLGGKDADDPQFRDALEMVKRDPALAEWFAREQAFDSRLSEKIRAFPVPADLEGQLLAARKVMPTRVSWRRAVWMAVAACIALTTIMAILFFRPSAKPNLAEFRAYVADATAKLERLDLVSRDVTELRQWLQKRGAPGDFVIPGRLDSKPSIGCRVFDWHGQRVSLVCFDLENGHEVHLFVVDRTTLRDAPAGTPPQFAAMNGGISIASWSSEQRVYVLATNAGEQELRRVL